MQNRCAEIKLRAERRAGVLLSGMEKNKGAERAPLDLIYPPTRFNWRIWGASPGKIIYTFFTQKLIFPSALPTPHPATDRVLTHIANVVFFHFLLPPFRLKGPREIMRYFHLLDPDGHELSFAKPLP